MLGKDLFEGLDNVLGGRGTNLGMIKDKGTCQTELRPWCATHARNDLRGEFVLVEEDGPDIRYIGNIALDDGQLGVDLGLGDTLFEEHGDELRGSAGESCGMETGVQGVNQSGIGASTSGAKESNETRVGVVGARSHFV